jgi:hypothetical protein
VWHSLPAPLDSCLAAGSASVRDKKGLITERVAPVARALITDYPDHSDTAGFAPRTGLGSTCLAFWSGMVSGDAP